MARPGLTFEQVNAMGRAGQAFQVDYAASGGQANTAAVQREIAPRVFAPDNAQLSPEGSILAPGAPRQAVATQQTPNPRVFAPDGANLSPEGGILSLPSMPSAPTPTPAPQAERGNNPNATYNAATNTWNVDPADAWKQASAPPTTTPPATPTAREREELLLPPPPAPDVAAYDRSIGVPNPAASPSPQQPSSREQLWLDWLLGRSGGSAVPAYAEGGSHMMPGGGMMPGDTHPGPMALPDAIVGEGLEAQTPQFDTESRGELVLEPQQELGPDIFKVTYAEGPTGVQAGRGMLVLPLSGPAEAIAREHLAGTSGVKGAMNGDRFEVGPLSLPTAPGGEGAKIPAFAEGTGDYYYGNQAYELEQPGTPAPAPAPATAPAPAPVPTTAPPPPPQYNWGHSQPPPAAGALITPPPPGAAATSQPAAAAAPPGAIRGIYPPSSLLGPSEEWAGFPGGAPPPLGNLTEYARMSEGQRERYKQMLLAMGLLGGIQAIEADLRRSAPGRLGLASYAG